MQSPCAHPTTSSRSEGSVETRHMMPCGDVAYPSLTSATMRLHTHSMRMGAVARASRVTTASPRFRWSLYDSEMYSPSPTNTASRHMTSSAVPKRPLSRALESCRFISCGSSAYSAKCFHHESPVQRRLEELLSSAFSEFAYDAVDVSLRALSLDLLHRIATSGMGSPSSLGLFWFVMWYFAPAVVSPYGARNCLTASSSDVPSLSSSPPPPPPPPPPS